MSENMVYPKMAVFTMKMMIAIYKAGRNGVINFRKPSASCWLRTELSTSRSDHLRQRVVQSSTKGESPLNGVE